jgi:predicted amino acid racemase
MPGTFQLVLDTLGPQAVTLLLDPGGPNFTMDRVVTAIPGTSSTDAVLMKIWGDVDITVTTGDGVKTVNVRLRDDVGNTSSVATDTITLDTTAPVITIDAGPTSTAGGAPPKISKNAGFDDASITWHADSDIGAYKIKFVPTTGADQSQGTTIPTAAGSTNVNVTSDGTVKVAAATQVTSHIKGADLDTAAANGDGTKQLKIFVQDMAGNWSVL